MIIASLILIYTFIILFAYGQGTIFLLHKILLKQAQFSIPFQLIIGLMTITTLASFASLFIRINWEFQSVLITGALLLFFFVVCRSYAFQKLSLRNFNTSQIIGLIIFIGSSILILYAATLTPTNPDTGIYHAQTIRWIETYPVVPGLVNLHDRLAYDSSFLLATTIFSFSYLKIESFHLLTGALFLIMAGYCYQGIHELLGKKYLLSNFLKLGFYLSLFIFLFDQVSSPGTDAPATLLIWFIIAQTIRFFEERQLEEDLQGFFLILLCFFCVTIKISTAPLLLLALGLMVFLNYFKKFRNYGLAALCSFVILLPFVARNIILTGYPIYPGFPFDLFHLDWRTSVENVKNASKTIHWFATLPNISFQKFSSLSWRDQTIQWFDNLIPRQKAILQFILASLLANGLLCVFKEWRIFLKQNKSTWIVYLTAIAGCVAWFVCTGFSLWLWLFNRRGLFIGFDGHCIFARKNLIA